MYPPASPRRSSNSTLKIVLILTLVVVLPCIALILFGVFAVRAGMGLVRDQFGPIASCDLRFVQARDALLLYAGDHGGRLPLAANWQDALAPYIFQAQAGQPGAADAEKMFGIEFLPRDGDWGCQLPEGGMTGMAFNKELSGKQLAEITDRRGTIVLFEIPEPRRNAAGSYVPKPAADSPRFMGTPRGWARIGLEGDTGLMGEGGREARLRYEAEMKKGPDEPAKAKN
jgi:hypothetical protein